MAFRKRTMMPSVFVSFFKLIYIFYLVEGHIWRPTMLCQLLLVQLPWCSREGVKAIRRGSRMEERGSAECEDVFGWERGQVLDWCRASGWGKLCRCEIVFFQLVGSKSRLIFLSRIGKRKCEMLLLFCWFATCLFATWLMEGKPWHIIGTIKGIWVFLVAGLYLS